MLKWINVETQFSYKCSMFGVFRHLEKGKFSQSPLSSIFVMIGIKNYIIVWYLHWYGTMWNHNSVVHAHGYGTMWNHILVQIFLCLDMITQLYNLYENCFCFWKNVDNNCMKPFLCCSNHSIIISTNFTLPSFSILVTYLSTCRVKKSPINYDFCPCRSQ